MNFIVLAAAVLFQQQPATRPSTDTSAVAVSRQAFTDVGMRVAEVRRALDLYRRAAFNSPNSVAVERAQVLQSRCAELDVAARAARTRMCRACFTADVQPAIERYRGGLVGAAQLGARCAGVMARRLRADPTGTAARSDARSASELIVEGLRPYENRVRGVRVAFGLEVAAPQPTPRRPRR
jgi:hypothetical protein